MASNLSRTARRRLRLLWGIALLLVIVGSLLPATSSAMISLGRLGIGDKVLHAAAYAVLGFLPALHERRSTLAAALLSAILLGVAMEFSQRLSPGRSFEIADMAADVCGVLCGLVFAAPLRSHAAPLHWN